MVFINDYQFYETPGTCGTCPCFFSGDTPMQANHGMGHCVMFDEWHHSYIYIPRRCAKLFKSAFTFPDGYKLVIVKNQ